MISFTVLINKQSHITRHLSTFQITFHKHSFVYCFTPLRSPPFILIRVPCKLPFLQRHVHRINARIYTSGTDKRVRPYRGITYGNSCTCRSISLSFQFQMKPHDELPGLLIIDYFGSLNDTTFFYITSNLIRYS